MAASPRISLLVVLLAVISFATSNLIHGSAELGFETGIANEQQGENNDAQRGRFGFPYSGIIFRGGNKVDIGSGVSAEHQSENRDQTDLARTPNKLSHEDPQYLHGRSAHNSDTDNERKFRLPHSVSVTFTRSNEQNSELGADTNDYIGQGGVNHEHHHHNHSADNDDADGERKFRWPGSIGITISRSNKQNLDEDDEPKFFGLIPSLAPCNHTEQAGRSCYDCTHTLLCFANDIGIKRNCSPLYCNQGRCSVEPSDECSSSTY